MRRDRIYSIFLALLLIAFLNLNSANAQVAQEKPKETSSNTIAQDNIDSTKSISNLVCHFNNKIRIVFSDIDGTLIPFAKKGPKGEVPESVKLAFQKLKRENIPLILVTGRSCWEEHQIAKRMGNENIYMVSQQGAEITTPDGKIIYEDNINHKDSVKIFKDIEAFKKAHKQDSKIFFYYKGKPYATEEYSLPYTWEKRTVLKSINDLKKLNPKFEFCKIGIYDPNPENLVAIQSYLKNKYPNYHIDISADCYCDISSATATKGNAVKKLAEMLRVDLKNTATFGDAENDVSMLNLVKTNGGLAVAVGNAMPKTKESANYITAPACEDGFAKAVDKILINNALLK